MIEKNLVSIITPCYNTGKYLPKLMDSILSQSYPYIEMITIDDGSTDNTEEIIKSYIDKFKNKGYKLTYIRQENSGQSVAIQKGIELIRGEYLVWPDSDDYYNSTEAISKMVERFKKSSSDIGMVRTQEILVEDTTEHIPVFLDGKNAKEIEESSLFEDCLFEQNNFYYCPGGYMIKTEALKKSTKFPIYTSKNAGQNWQLMLPVLYNFRCSTILEPLYTVVIRTDSHSRDQFIGYERIMMRYKAHYEVILKTLETIIGMDSYQLSNYKKEIHKKYNLIFLKLSLDNRNRKNSKIYYKILKNNKLSIPFKLKIYTALLKIGILDSVLSSYKIFKKLIRI